MTVLIQGAGIAGLALAREFTKAGVSFPDPQTPHK